MSRERLIFFCHLKKTDQKVDLIFLGFKVPAGKVCVGGAGMALPGPCNAQRLSDIYTYIYK